MERKAELKYEAKSGRVGVKARHLVPQWTTEAKKDKFIAKLKERGLWSWDDDWPQDEEENA